MKSKLILLALIFSSGLAFAQVIPPTIPVITDAQKLAYFKAQLQAQAAQAQAQSAQASLQTAVKAITDTCGKDFSPSMDAHGDPVCVVKDAPVKK